MSITQLVITMIVFHTLALVVPMLIAWPAEWPKQQALNAGSLTAHRKRTRSKVQKKSGLAGVAHSA